MFTKEDAQEVDETQLVNEFLQQEALGSMFRSLGMGIASALMIGYVYALITGTDLLCQSIKGFFGVG